MELGRQFRFTFNRKQASNFYLCPPGNVFSTCCVLLGFSLSAELSTILGLKQICLSSIVWGSDWLGLPVTITMDPTGGIQDK